jgi:hypothetical protein
LLEVFCIISLASPSSCSNSDVANILVKGRKYGLLVQTLRRPYVASYNDPGLLNTFIQLGPGSVVGVVTVYGLDGPGIESQWGARFSEPVHTGPGAYPATCTMGTGSFPG